MFPRVAKCTYKSYGPSGSSQIFDALCLLPLNVLNQKIFVIIWIWYTLQLLISILNLIYWVVVYYSRNLRIEILRRCSLMSMSSKQIMQATNTGHLGNFFVLRQIAKNTNTITFVEILKDLSMQNLSTVNLDLNGGKSI